jgi:hypothetical protein
MTISAEAGQTFVEVVHFGKFRRSVGGAVARDANFQILMHSSGIEMPHRFVAGSLWPSAPPHSDDLEEAFLKKGALVFGPVAGGYGGMRVSVHEGAGEAGGGRKFIEILTAFLKHAGAVRDIPPGFFQWCFEKLHIDPAVAQEGEAHKTRITAPWLLDVQQPLLLDAEAFAALDVDDKDLHVNAFRFLAQGAMPDAQALWGLDGLYSGRRWLIALDQVLALIMRKAQALPVERLPWFALGLKPDRFDPRQHGVDGGTSARGGRSHDMFQELLGLPEPRSVGPPEAMILPEGSDAAKVTELPLLLNGQRIGERSIELDL